MDKAIELLRELAGKLGQTVEALWPEVVAYTAIQGLLVIVAWFLVVIFAYCFTFLFLRKQGWLHEISNHEKIPSVKSVSLLFTIIFTLMFFVSIAINLPRVINPVGYVTLKIINKK